MAPSWQAPVAEVVDVDAALVPVGSVRSEMAADHSAQYC